MVQESAQGGEGRAGDVAAGLGGQGHVEEGLQVVQGIHHRPVCIAFILVRSRGGSQGGGFGGEEVEIVLELTTSHCATQPRGGGDIMQ